MLADITYISDRKLDEQLGCPVETHGCFYSFADDAGGGRLLSPALGSVLKQMPGIGLVGCRPAHLGWHTSSKPALLSGS